MTERPDLFAVVIDRMGANDVLRHEQFSKGGIPEFGTVADSAQSRYLYDMDVVQHVKDRVSFPAVLFQMEDWLLGKPANWWQHYNMHLQVKSLFCCGFTSEEIISEKTGRLPMLTGPTSGHLHSGRQDIPTFSSQSKLDGLIPSP